MYEILKVNKTKARAIIKYLQKKNDTERNSGFELLKHRPNLPDSAPSDFYLIPKLKSHLPGRQFENKPCCGRVFGGQGCNLFSMSGLQSSNIAGPKLLMLRETILTLSQTTNFRLSKLKEFADDNFKFYENGKKFFKLVENNVGKGEIARK